MRSIIFIYFLAGYFITAAQEKISEISTPASPASSVLGFQATEILAPKNFKALETALYSNFVDGNNNAIIPNDFALEFTPYWASDHGLGLNEYLFPKTIADQVWRNSSFSIASTQNLLLGDSTPTNGLGFGYRTTIYFSSESDRKTIRKYSEDLGDYQGVNANIGALLEGEMANGRITTREEFVKFVGNILPGQLTGPESETLIDEILSDLEASARPEFDIEHPEAFLENFYDIVNTVMHGEQIFHEFESYIKERNGLSIDIAAAWLVNFPTNDFEFSYAPRRSIWITPAYRFRNKLEFLKVIGVLRKDWYDLDYYRKYYADTQYFKTNTDYGLGVAGEFRKFSLQAEIIGRMSYTEYMVGADTDGNDLYRKETKYARQYVGTFSYRLNDDLVLSYSIGEKFNLGTIGKSLVSLLSLNLGFGDPPVLKSKE
jgi:hypothetical protein